MSETRSTVLSIGELLIDFIPTQNGAALADVPLFQRAAGGAPANVATAIARLGGQARLLSQVGADAFGQFLVQCLADEHVDVSCVLRTDEALTGLAFVSLRTDGERDFLFYRAPAADMLLRTEHIPAHAYDHVGIVHFGSVSLVAEPSRSTTTDVVSTSRRLGCLISYDPNIRLPLWPVAEEARAIILAHIAHAHLVKVSEEEVCYLTEQADPIHGGNALLECGPEVVVVTLGASGCRVHTRTEVQYIPGFMVQAIDTTGAGDAFVGGLLYELSQGGITPDTIASYFASPQGPNAVRRAHAVAALTTTRRGAIPALPTQAELSEWLDSRNADGGI